MWSACPVPPIGMLLFVNSTPVHDCSFDCSQANGEKKLGATLHVVDEGIHTGPLIGIRWLDAVPDRSVLWHEINLYRLGMFAFF